MSRAPATFHNGTQIYSEPAAQRPSKADLQSAFDSSLFFTLTLWPPLVVAVQNLWAGSATIDKRDWFVGAISTLFDDRPETDVEDVEEVMLQVMADEFDVEVQDESGAEVAAQIMLLRERILGNGDVGVVEAARRRWETVQGTRVRMVDGGEREEEADEDEEEDAGDVDVEMDDAPALVNKAPKEKVEPEIDEDGFTKVVSKKKR